MNVSANGSTGYDAIACCHRATHWVLRIGRRLISTAGVEPTRDLRTNLMHPLKTEATNAAICELQRKLNREEALYRGMESLVQR